MRSADCYRFGPFELQLDERLLLKDGAAVPLRPRAFDLLAVMVDRSGHLVTKDELLDRVWPGMVVEEAAIHVQVSALRKVLGVDTIATVSGQGYRFTLSVTRAEAETRPESAPRHNLPSQLTSFIGREQEIAQLSACTSSGLGAPRCVSRRRLAGRARSAVRPGLVTQAVVSALGQQEQPGRPLIETLVAMADQTLGLICAAARPRSQLIVTNRAIAKTVSNVAIARIDGSMASRMPLHI